MAAARPQQRQDEVFAYLADHVRRHGYAPSIREIGEALGLRSTSTVHHHLTALAKRGLIAWDGGKNRAIRVLVQEAEAVAFEASTEVRGLPMLGRIAAGRPIDAIAQADERIDLDALFNGPERYMLKVRGDSMIEDHIQDGDMVVVQATERVRDGEIAVCLLEDDEVTLKRLYKEPNGLFRLQPANASMAPIFAERVQVQGKVVGVVRTC